MKRILVGVDGSPESLDAVTWTADFASSLGAEVIVATVFGFRPVISGPGAVYYITQDTLGEWRKDLEKEMQGAWTQPFRDAGVTIAATVIEEGNAADVLLTLAKTRDVDFIVVGSRGHGAVAGMILGSVSHNLVLRSQCPVIVLPHSHARDHRTVPEPEMSAAPSGIS